MEFFDYVTIAMLVAMAIIFCLSIWGLYRSLSGKEEKEYEAARPKSRYSYEHQEAISLLWNAIMIECEADEPGSLARYKRDVGLPMVILKDRWSDQIKMDALGTFFNHLTQIGKHDLRDTCLSLVARYKLSELAASELSTRPIPTGQIV